LPDDLHQAHACEHHGIFDNGRALAKEINYGAGIVIQLGETVTGEWVPIPQNQFADTCNVLGTNVDPRHCSAGMGPAMEPNEHHGNVGLMMTMNSTSQSNQQSGPPGKHSAVLTFRRPLTGASAAALYEPVIRMRPCATAHTWAYAAWSAAR
jgi:hypothetical protein